MQARKKESDCILVKKKRGTGLNDIRVTPKGAIDPTLKASDKKQVLCIHVRKKRTTQNLLGAPTKPSIL